MSELFFYFVIVGFAAVGAGFALWKGGAAERYAALVAIANLLIGFLGTWLLPQSEAVIRLCNDGLAAIVLLVITIRYAALWMGAVMLFYAAQFSLHSFYLITDRPTNDYFHALVNNVDFSGVIWCLIIGTAVAWRGRVRASSNIGPAQPAP